MAFKEEHRGGLDVGVKTRLLVMERLVTRFEEAQLTKQKSVKQLAMFLPEVQEVREELADVEVRRAEILTALLEQERRQLDIRRRDFVVEETLGRCHEMLKSAGGDKTELEESIKTHRECVDERGRLKEEAREAKESVGDLEEQLFEAEEEIVKARAKVKSVLRDEETIETAKEQLRDAKEFVQANEKEYRRAKEQLDGLRDGFRWGTMAEREPGPFMQEFSEAEKKAKDRRIKVRDMFTSLKEVKEARDELKSRNTDLVELERDHKKEKEIWKKSHPIRAKLGWKYPMQAERVEEIKEARRATKEAARVVKDQQKDTVLKEKARRNAEVYNTEIDAAKRQVGAMKAYVNVALRRAEEVYVESVEHSEEKAPLLVQENERNRWRELAPGRRKQREQGQSCEVIRLP